MQQFTIEYWYYYNGTYEKDFEKETITAVTYEAAVAILKSLHKHIFKTIDKTVYEINN